MLIPCLIGWLAGCSQTGTTDSEGETSASSTTSASPTGSDSGETPLETGGGESGEASAGDTARWSVPDAADVRVAFIGDYGEAGEDLATVAALIEAWAPAFIATMGGNNYPIGAADTIDENVGQYFHRYIMPYKGGYGLGSPDFNRFYPSLGNHDWDTPGIAPYLDYFTLPGNERYYDVEWGPLHLFVVDSDPRNPDGIGANENRIQDAV